jgi:hypothetical protein
MKDPETASIQSISRAEIFTSRQAIQMEIPVTRRARNVADVPRPVRLAAKGFRSGTSRQLRLIRLPYKRGAAVAPRDGGRIKEA